MIKDYFILAVRNLQKRQLRTWLTMLGIFISIATIFMLVSLSLGLQGAVEEQFQILGTDKFFVIPATGFLSPPGSGGSISLTEADVEVIKKVKGVNDYSYVTVANAKVEFSGETKFLIIIGLPLEKMDVWTESGAWGTEFGKDLQEGDLGKITLGSLFAEGKVFSKQILPGNKLTINDERFKVQGIAKQIGNSGDDSSILMPLEDVRRLFQIPNRVDQIAIKIESDEKISIVAERVEKELRSSRGVTEDTQDFTILTPDELLESFGAILDIITGFLLSVAAISLLVGGIGIANTMYTSVLERTKEIGVMKAIGAQNKDILMIFMIESGLLGLIGAIVGVLLGFGLSKGIEFISTNSLDTTLLQVATPFWLIGGCLVFGFLIGAVSGTLPAWQASKINVVDALRYE
jgi:putative ABC transport system permease protein